MTALLLLALIAGALLAQAAAALGVAIWRRSAEQPVVAATGGAIPAVTAGAWSGWREFRVERRAFEDRASTQCSFYLVPCDGAPLPPFKPGQYLTFQIQVSGPLLATATEPRTITRCYSLSDQPSPARYRVTIKKALAPVDKPEWPAGISSGHFHAHVIEGSRLQVRAPAGHFHIGTDTTPAVLIAGGVGITPMMSMLNWCLAEQPGRTLHLFYGVRDGREHAFKQALEQLARDHPAFKLHVVYSRPAGEDIADRDFQHTGYVSVDLLRKTLPHGRHSFYVCGPPAMMESIVPALADWGVAPQDIHFEAFGPASVHLPGQTLAPAKPLLPSPHEVRFTRAGRTLGWNGTEGNLLDFAEHHGVEVPSGCRSGSCGSCETRLLSGAVEYANKPDFDVSPGSCLLCVGTPASDLVLEA